jgi:ADP-ribose pyrophosphatase YjhB (NUDIX family)
MIEPIRRKAIRALILTPQGQVLLMRVGEPGSSFRVWITPGGGVLQGESAECCLRRELLEETGLRDFQIGPLVWTRHHIFDWAGRGISQEETYYLIEVEYFTPEVEGNPGDTEKDAFLQFRWWTAGEIMSSDELFAPRLLGEHLRDLAKHGPP